MNKWLCAWQLLCLLLVGSACTQSEPSPSDSSTIQQLRISNIGHEDIQDLIVVFPGSTPAEIVRVDFSDVPAGETTEYKPISSGIYRYAAYEYTLEDETLYQPVVDWIGEKPLEGVQFTNEIRLDTTRVKGDQIQLVGVLNE